MCFDIAGDDEDGVFRRIESIVIGKRVGPIETFDLMAPADDRPAVGMLREKRRLQGLAKLFRGIGIGAHPPLFENDIALGRHYLVGQDQIFHPVGLIVHADVEVLLGDALEIGGVVIRGESILLAAEIGDQLGKLALRMVLVPLNIKCSRKCAMPDLPDRIVGRAIAIPDHMRHDGRPVVLDDDDLETVGELCMRDRRTGGFAVRVRRGVQKDAVPRRKISPKVIPSIAF